MRIRPASPQIFRVLLLVLAAILLFAPYAQRSAVYLTVEEMADMLILALVLGAGPSGEPALAVSVSALLAADTLYSVFYLFPGSPKALFPALVTAYMVYNLAAAVFLFGAFRAAGPLKKTESALLLLLFSCFTFLQVRYVLIPVGTGVYASPAVWVLASIQRVAESAVLSMAVVLGMKARTRYWFWMLNGLTLLPLSSFAIGYNASASQGVPFAEYGWILGLLSVLAAQTYVPGEAEPFARWSSIRVRLVWFVSSITTGLLLILYLLQAFVSRDTFHLTASLFFVMFGVWLAANLTAFGVSEYIRSLLDGLRMPGPQQAPHGFAIYEADLFAEKLRAAYDTIREQSGLAAMASISAQVAHDIRSPLAALESAIRALPELPAEKRDLISAAAGRIKNIADDLLARNGSGAAKPAAPVLPSALIEEAVAEKRAQLAGRGDISITARLDAGARGAAAAADAAALARILSNLINNALEALPGRGSVTVGLSASGGAVTITVGDDGKGIPPEILAGLGQRGRTHGKAGGTGLGLYHARTTVEAWGGKFRISSAPGKGTVVSLALKRASPRSAAPGSLAVLLDDDELVHMNWRLSAKKAGMELKCYKEAAALLAAAAGFPKDTPLYIDSELGSGVSGEETAAEMHRLGFSDITMATGRDATVFAGLTWLKVAGKEPPWESA